MGLPASLTAGRARDLSRLAHSNIFGITLHLLCVSGGRSLAIEIAVSWTESLGPRARIAIVRTRKIRRLTCSSVEPPIGIEPMTYALRGACSPAAHALAALIAPAIALTALAALGL